MPPKPQETPQDAAPYRPDPAILTLAAWLGDEVQPARFPQQTLRFRNRRAEHSVGLQGLTDTDWLAQFARFESLPGNLPAPLALRYHGHQFQVYNPELGDGRGFLFAQLRDGKGRLLDLGTKGSGQTPWSRAGDGRLTLRGAIREVLATEMLEALGVDTSKTLTVVETGEELERHDEPPPVRSAVLTRLSHSHIRIGSFQRLAALEERDHLAALADYCLTHFPGPPPPADAPDRDNPAVILLHHVVERLADLAASYMTAGFVHGVLNTDNMNITGESFDYGPWRFLPAWDPAHVAAYFDHSGLYAFGRQPQAIHWNCAQLAVALRPLAEAPGLIAALDQFGPLYEANLQRRWCWRMGVAPAGTEADKALVAASERAMTDSGASPDAFFHAVRAGQAPDGIKDHLESHEALHFDQQWFAGNAPVGLPIDHVNTLLSACVEREDWSALDAKIADIRALGCAMGPPPFAAGHPA